MRLSAFTSLTRLGLIALGLGAAVLLFTEFACWLFFRPVDNGFPYGLFVKRTQVGYTGSPGWNAQVARIHPHNVSINSQGFRDDEWTKHLNEPRMLMVGSTALFGLGVGKNDRLSERVASRLGITVHNAGMYGYGSPQALWTLREFCKRGDYKVAMYVHEYKLTRNDFLRNPARSVVDGLLVNLPHEIGNEVAPLKPTFIGERLKLLAFREFLANHELSPRQIYEAWLGLENFDEQYFLSRHAVTADENSFSKNNLIKTAENIRKMQQAADHCGAKFVAAILPGPLENRFRKDEPSTKELLGLLDGIPLIDVRHILPIESKLFLPGLDYFNPATIDAFARYITASVDGDFKNRAK